MPDLARKEGESGLVWFLGYADVGEGLGGPGVFGRILGTVPTISGIAWGSVRLDFASRYRGRVGRSHG